MTRGGSDLRSAVRAATTPPPYIALGCRLHLSVYVFSDQIGDIGDSEINGRRVSSCCVHRVQARPPWRFRKSFPGLAVTLAVTTAVCGGHGWGSNPARTPQQRPANGFQDRRASLCSSPPTSAQAHSSGATIRHRPLASVFIRRLGCHLGCQRMNQRTANLDSRSHYPSPESGSRLAIQCAGGSIRSPGAASCCSTSQRAAAYAREIISLTTSY